MTIGCLNSDSGFKPCADCSFEYQPRECREQRHKLGSKTIDRSASWDTYDIE